MEISSVTDELTSSQANVYGAVPPETVKSMDPSNSPAQLALICVCVKLMAAGSVIVNVPEVNVHKLPSTTVRIYDPGVNPDISADVPTTPDPSDHE